MIKAAEELDELWGSIKTKAGKDYEREFTTCRKTLLMFACLTGCRQSEILGLAWDNVDLESGRIFIRQTYHDGQFFPPKSQAGRQKPGSMPLHII